MGDKRVAQGSEDVETTSAGGKRGGMERGEGSIKRQKVDKAESVPDTNMSLLKSFKKYLQTSKSSSITRETLFSFIPRISRSGAHWETTALNLFQVLFRENLLVAHDHDYIISSPGINNFVKHLREGRKEIVAILRRTRFKEMLEKVLLSKKMTSSHLGMSFHLRDALGRCELEKVSSTSGDLIRIKK
jgi:hypothetical protein